MSAIPNSRLLMACALLTGMLSWPLRSSADVFGPEALAPDSSGLVSFGEGVLDSAALDRYRGGTEVFVDNTNFTDGAVYGNHASNLVTGSNIIDASFTGASGLSTVVQNSGNNVLIQTPIIVNLQVQ